MADPGRVYWSGSAQRFYQEGRQGALRREAVLDFITYDDKVLRYRDQRGQFVSETVLAPRTSSSRVFIAHDSEGRPFVTTTMRDTVVTETEAVRHAYQANEQIVVRTVVRTADGRVYRSVVSAGRGRTPNLEDIKETARKAAAQQLRDAGYDIHTADIPAFTVVQTFAVRTTTIRGE